MYYVLCSWNVIKWIQTSSKLKNKNIYVQKGKKKKVKMGAVNPLFVPRQFKLGKRNICSTPSCAYVCIRKATCWTICYNISLKYFFSSNSNPMKFVSSLYPSLLISLITLRSFAQVNRHRN